MMGDGIGLPEWRGVLVWVIGAFLWYVAAEWWRMKSNKACTRNWYNWPTLYERPGRLPKDDGDDRE